MDANFSTTTNIEIYFDRKELLASFKVAGFKHSLTICVDLLGKVKVASHNVSYLTKNAKDNQQVEEALVA